ncbi:kinase-like domain-containing protein [Camillea tinctor]|nr:kinase-like domain-containing protein [Camillea tinctor]
MNEIAIMKRLSKHRNQHVVRLVNAFAVEDKNQYCLIMDPVADRGNLKDYLANLFYDPLPLTTVQKDFLMDAIRGLANGLAFIHRTTTLHKDTKPENILIHRNKVLYTDFGIALDFSSMPTSTTASTNPFYTFEYAAPELVARNKLPRNIKSDIFSLGCVYFEILAIYFGATDLKALTIYDNGNDYTSYRLMVDKLQIIRPYGNEGDLCASMLSRDRDVRPSADEVERKIPSYGAATNIV